MSARSDGYYGWIADLRETPARPGFLRRSAIKVAELGSGALVLVIFGGGLLIAVSVRVVTDGSLGLDGIWTALALLVAIGCRVAGTARQRRQHDAGPRPAEKPE